MKSSRSPAYPHEVGPNRAKNEGQKPRAEQRIAGFSKLKVASGPATAKGPGTPSPTKKNTVSGMGYTTATKRGGATRPQKQVEAKFGRGPGGIGKTGIGAPWG